MQRIYNDSTPVRRARYFWRSGCEETGHEIAESIGLLIQPGARAGLYAKLVEDVADGLDENAYPVLSGLARTGPGNAAELAAVIGLDQPPG